MPLCLSRLLERSLRQARFFLSWFWCQRVREKTSMKTLISAFALALALAFVGPAFAGDVTAAKTEADCNKAGGMWDAATNTCSEKKM